MPLRLRLLRRHKARRFRAPHALASHFANYLGGGKGFLLALARHGGCPHLRTFHPQKCNNRQIKSRIFVATLLLCSRPIFMDEREFFDERSDKKPANLSCPHCQQSAEYEIQWLVRMKKKSLPPRADDRDRAKFAKAQSYMLRRDDMLMCKNMRCRKRFEITGVQSVAFLQDGLPAAGH